MQQIYTAEPTGNFTCKFIFLTKAFFGFKHLHLLHFQKKTKKKQAPTVTTLCRIGEQLMSVIQVQDKFWT